MGILPRICHQICMNCTRDTQRRLMASARIESNGFNWAEDWFKYRFVTEEYAEKNAIK